MPFESKEAAEERPERTQRYVRTHRRPLTPLSLGSAKACDRRATAPSLGAAPEADHRAGLPGATLTEDEGQVLSRGRADTNVQLGAERFDVPPQGAKCDVVPVLETRDRRLPDAEKLSDLHLSVAEERAQFTQGDCRWW